MGKSAEELLQKYKLNTCTPEEKLIVQEWFMKFSSGGKVDISLDNIERIKAEMWDVIQTKRFHAKKKIIWPRIAAAASIVICIGIGFYFYQKDNTSPNEIITKNDIAPGGNKAFLTLADGKRIVLTNAKIGELAEQSGAKITKATDGQLIYTVSNLPNQNTKINAYNIIETPRGGTYQVRLPDGTKVWLNAASTLRFPSSFARLVNRRVELLSGEAYFEVAKDKKHPFIVQTDQQEVEVLGTHFNINNYGDDSRVKTTLLEGKVRLTNLQSSATSILQPGQQAALTNNDFHIYNADLEAAVAWKNNKFMFDSENIEAVMKKIERWYNVTVSFEGERPTDKFIGSVSRFDQLSSVLNLLELTGNVHFKIEGRRVIVKK